MDGTDGLVLLNDGSGNFTALKHDESGFKNSGYGKCLRAIKGVQHEQLLLSANNNSTLLFFKFLKLKNP